MDVSSASFIRSGIVFIVDGAERDVVGRLDLLDILGEQPDAALRDDGALVFTAMKRQVEVLLRRSRIEVVERAGKAPSEARLGSIAVEVLGLLGGRATAVGFNYELAVPLSESERVGAYLAEHLLSFSGEQVGEAPLSVTSLQFTLPADSLRTSVRIEPRWGKADGSELYFNINVHEDFEEPQPRASADQLDSLFDERFSLVRAVLEKMP